MTITLITGVVSKEQIVSITSSSKNVWVDGGFEVIFTSGKAGGKTHFKEHPLV